MPAPIGSRPVVTPDLITKSISEVANSSAVTTVGDAATTVANLADQFEVGAGLVSKLGASQAGTKVAGAVAGAVANTLNPKALAGTGEVLTAAASKLGLSSGALSSLGKVGGAALHGAGIAAIGYDAVQTFANSEADLGSRSAQAVASVAAGAATFIPVVGPAILAAEVITGGGVSGGVKGLVALGDAALTGDRTALNEWKKNAKEGNMGWAIELAASPEARARLANKVSNGVETAKKAVTTTVATATRAVTNTVAEAKKAVTTTVATATRAVTNTVADAKRAVGNVASNISAGWRALTSW